MAKRNDDLRRWAIAGAEQRLVEIAAEAAAIHQTFPELRRRARASFGADPTGGRSKQSNKDRPTTRRRKMSAEARRAVSQRMKKYWADRRTKK